MDAQADLADRIAAEVLAHPGVARLDGGAFGTVVTHLPGRRVVGVQVGERGVEVSVVIAAGSPIPAVTGEVRDRVRAVAGRVPVDVHVADVENTADTADTPPKA